MNKYIQRFWSKTDKTKDCWLWGGSLNKKGYGQFYDGAKMKRAHRYAYEMTFGKIPIGYTVDHACHNVDISCVGGNDCVHRRCVNPKHLEAIPHKENCNRATQKIKFCKYNHSCGLKYNYNSNYRSCRECSILSHRKYRLLNKKPREIRAIKTHCPQGHEYTKENTYISEGKYKNCITCRKVWRTNYELKQKSLVA